MKNKFFIILASVLIFLQSNSCLASDYETHWAKSEIEQALNNKIITLTEQYFYPDQVATIQEIKSVCNKLNIESLDAVNDIKSLDSFTTESQNSGMTREELAIIVSKILNLDIVLKDKTTFADDDDIFSWSKCYVAKLQEKKILVGYPDSTFKPKNKVTKAELVTIANRCQLYLGQEDTTLENKDVSKIEIGFFEYKDEGLSISKIEDKISLKVGEELQLAISIPEKLIGQTVDFEIQNVDVIQIDEETLELTAIGSGNTIVRFFVNGTTYETIIQVMVE